MIKRIKKLLAIGLSTCMVVGVPMTVAAADDPIEVTAPVYSLNVTEMVLPTTLSMAFNPESYEIKTGEGAEDKSTDQVVSLNYGMINKSSRDKTVKVAFTAAEANEGTKITFVDSAEKVDEAASTTWALYLEAVPVEVTATVNLETAAADLAGIAGTADVTGTNDVAIAGSGAIGFNLKKATYALKEGESVDMAISGGAAVGNSLAEKFEVSALAAEGDGVAAFTLSGAMNTNADWSQVTNGVTVSVTYTITDAPAEAEYGVTALSTAPTFTSNSALTIDYTAGAGDAALTSIESITAVYPSSGNTFDIYAANSSLWAAATDENNKITFDSKIPDFWTEETVDVTVNYKAGEVAKTATVTLKLK